ncbi:hypothetical protein OC834_000437 [Tilletia horrida]|nr:hypothetical protein OC834_000437 [Tilletia horrida]
MRSSAPLAVLALSLLALLATLSTPASALPFPRWVPSLLSSSSSFLFGPLRQRAATTPTPTVCNGSAKFCGRKFSNYTFIGTHDSYAISSWNLAANQDVSITTQLNAGIRMLQSQAHRSPNKTVSGVGIDLCHTNCVLYQGGALESYLAEVKAWMDKNPTEVLSLLIVNSDDLPASQFAQAFESTGLASKSYRPASGRATGTIARADWPTLGELISAGTPLVNFLASGADDSVPYLLSEFDKMAENAYDQLSSTPFNCSIDRIAPGADPSQLMFLANHFKDARLLGSPIVVPDKLALPKTNSKAQVLADANNCAKLHGRWPTFILVDFFNTPKKNGPLDAGAFINANA